MAARSSRFRQGQVGRNDPAVAAANHLATAERFAGTDPRRAANQRAAARLVAADAALLDAPALRRWRAELQTWVQFVPYLVDDATETRLTSVSREVIRVALADLATLEDSQATALGPAEFGVTLLEAADPAERSGADAVITTVTDRRASMMCDVLERLTAAHASDDRTRGITNWRLRFAFSQGTTVETLDRLLGAVAERTETAQAWYTCRSGLVGSTYADRRAGPAVPVSTLADDAVLVADSFGAAVPGLRAEAARAAARIRPGGANEVVIEADGRMSVSVVHRPTARGRLMVAHELGHALHALRARSQTAPGALVGETMACFTALVSGLSMTRSATGTHRPAALAVGDMIIEELFVSALVCRFEDEIQRVVRRGDSLTVAHLGDAWLQLHGQLFEPAIDVPTLVRTHWARLPSLAMHPGHAVSYVWATVLGLAVQARLTAGSTAGDLMASAMQRGAMSADELPRMLGFEDDSWIDAGLDALDVVMAGASHQVDHER